MRIALISLFFCAAFFTAKAQSIITLLGGQVFEGGIITEGEDFFVYEFTTPKGKHKVRTLDKDRVFSLVKDGREILYYEPGKHEKYTYSVQDMRYFIYGLQDARRNYTTGVPFTVALAVSLGTSLYFGSEGSFLTLAAPLPGMLIGSVTKGRNPAPSDASQESYLAYTSYIEGYREGARGRKLMAVLKGAALGTLAGGVVGFVIFNNK
jgi:hypothetical protein